MTVFRSGDGNQVFVRKEQVIQDKDKKATRSIEIILEKNRIIDGLGAVEESEDTYTFRVPCHETRERAL